jgi:membrane protein DedA with SNARE-associated domain
MSVLEYLSASVELLANVAIWGIVLSITIVGVVINWIAFIAGKRGGASEVVGTRVSPERFQQVEEFYGRYGNVILLLTAVPGVGNAAAAYAGIAGMNAIVFILITASIMIV